MQELGLSYTAIILATIANFFVGFLWYSVIFRNAWMKEMQIPMDVKPSAGMMIKSLVMNLVGCFFLAFVFAHNTAAWSFVPDIDRLGTVGSIANAAIFTWLGFFVIVDLNTVAFEGKSWKLFFINASYHFMMVLVSAIILHTL
jgi:Protein of unknown function (DUF1761)